MSWAFFDDKAPHHPKVLLVGAEAGFLWWASVCYSNAHQLDGRISKDPEILRAIYPPLARKIAKLACILTREKLWEERADHYQIHDYAVHQERALKEAVEERRAYERARKRVQREVRKAKTLAMSEEPVANAGTNGGTLSRDNGGTSSSSVPAARVGLGRDGIREGSSSSGEEDADERAGADHRARQPAHRVWQLYERVTNTTQGAATTHMAALHVVARVCAAEAKASEGAAYDQAVEKLLRAWLADPWVALKRPALSHLAGNVDRYLHPPAAGTPAFKRIAAVATATEHSQDARNNPAWLVEPGERKESPHE